MTKLFGRFFALIFCFSLFSYGLIVGKYEVFPYELIKWAKNSVAPSNNSTASKTVERLKIFQLFNSSADIAFVGDSLTAGGIWNEWFPNHMTVNRGIGGDRASDVRARIGTIVAASPSQAFLMMGINDVHQYVSVPKILSSYGAIVDSLNAEGIDVVIQSTIQCELSVCGESHVESVNALNEGLSELASEKKVKFLFLEELSSDGGLPSKYTTDGVHFSALGYAYWVDKIDALVE